MKDCLGNELVVGDLIVWPVKYADRVFMRSGKVIQVLSKSIRVAPDLRVKTWAYARSGKNMFIFRVENVTRVGFGEWGAP